MSSPDLEEKKRALRTEALRNRGLMRLTYEDVETITRLFFENIDVPEGTIIAGYWPKDRELDIRPFLDTLLERGITCALPVVEKGTRLLRFAHWNNDVELVQGKFGIAHPVINEKTKWLEPDIFLVPLLAFDRKGHRLGFGGGYYDTTLAHYREKKDIAAVGIAYAEQACLFHLPSDDHDMVMDWVITPQTAHSY